MPPKERYITYDPQKKLREILCYPCYSAITDARNKKRIKALAANNYIHTHLGRARRLGLPATLTLDQWNKTKAYFNFRCAYCQHAPIECLEHFVPLELGLGTVWENVVPACSLCNRRKNNLHPAIVTKIPKADIERVREYLLTLC
jgi:5-methylcytosine-specific restriction endonuclease McrA